MRHTQRKPEPSPENARKILDITGDPKSGKRLRLSKVLTSPDRLPGDGQALRKAASIFKIRRTYELCQKNIYDWRSWIVNQHERVDATIATSGRDMVITTGSQRTVIDWNSFSIGADSRLVINQPDAVSININRVVGTNPSKIFGSLTSNGRVVIANPNGIWFGRSARVDVAGIVASAGRISDAAVGNVMAGGALTIDAGNANASVINEGSITAAQGGFAALVAPGVRNSGIITARLGQVTLASGQTATVDFYGDGLINLAVAGQTQSTPLEAAVENSGSIYAEGGHVLLTANVAEGLLNSVINMSGVIEAGGVSTAGGVVELLGGSGSIELAGTIDVSAVGAHGGGHITVRAGDGSSRDGVRNLTGTLDAGSTGFGIAGDDAGNCVLSGQPTGLTATIDPALLTVSLVPGTISKVYDGSTAATLGAASYVIDGLVAGETIGISNTQGSFGTANAGSDLLVSVNLGWSDYVAGAGTSLANYALPTGSIVGTAGTILPASLLVRADDKAKVAGQPMPVFSVSYDGFVGEDSAASLGFEPTFSTAATAQSPADRWSPLLPARGRSMPMPVSTITGAAISAPSNITRAWRSTACLGPVSGFP